MFRAGALGGGQPVGRLAEPPEAIADALQDEIALELIELRQPPAIARFDGGMAQPLGQLATGFVDFEAVIALEPG